MKENVTREGVVVVIDDDASVRAALKELFGSVGLEARLYASAGAFPEARIPDATSCLVLDVRLPGMSGIKVQEELSRAGIYVPIVFVTGYGDVAMAVRAMKAGAIDFLTKPFRSQDLLDAVFAALERDSARRKMQQVHSTIRKHLESLSAREREVIARVGTGKLNKQIAAELGLSEVTVKVHRANAMRKMHATSLAHLIKMLEHVERSDMTSRVVGQLGEDLSRRVRPVLHRVKRLANVSGHEAQPYYASAISSPSRNSPAASASSQTKARDSP
jgi:FixJ family two-component response regulator